MINLWSITLIWELNHVSSLEKYVRVLIALDLHWPQTEIDKKRRCLMDFSTVMSYLLNQIPASVVHFVRTSSIMRVVMSSSLEWSEKFLIFHITYDSF